MIPIQPTNLLSYLSRQKQVISSDLHHAFYTSWEDALWDLLDYFQVKPNSTALVPEFFCGDVLNNMATHNLATHFYKVKKSLQTDASHFALQLKKCKPAVVVIFHPVGITNTLWQKKNIWLPYLPKNCLLIEDSVHRIIDPPNIKLLSSRHIVIDSLRKVVPLPGANVYLSSQFNDFQPQPAINNWYQKKVLYWWILFQLCLHVSQFLPSKKWQLYWNNWAEKNMLAGYDVIGDNQKGAAGWGWAKLVARYISPSKICAAKKKQVKIYQNWFDQTLVQKSSPFFAIPFPDTDAGQLRGFPVGIKISQADRVLQQLRQKGLLVRFELNDTPWSTKYKIIYLPLGPHINKNQINLVGQTILSSATATS